MDNTNVILLAGGVGSRMKRLNNIPKVFQTLDNIPMISLLVNSFIGIGINPEKIHIVLSPETEKYAKDNKVFKYVPVKTVIQKEANGSGGAVIAAIDCFKDSDRVMICNGDNPLITKETLKAIADSDEDMLSVMKVSDPTGYGRVVLKDGYIVQIVEEKDCNDDQRKIELVNTSIFLTNGKDLRNSLSKLDTNNAQNEYYLTDIVLHQKFRPYLIENHKECFNINTPEQLDQGKFYYLDPPKPKTRHVTINKGSRRLIVVGDIHGCYDPFMKLLDKCKYDEEKDILISVGDIIMKGPDSKKVVEWFSERKNLRVYCIRGNNEERELGKGRLVKLIGNLKLSIPEVTYLKSLPYTITVKDLDLLVVHAGIVPGKSLEEQDDWDMVKMRNLYKDKRGALRASHMTDIGDCWTDLWKGPPYIIYGHDAIRGFNRTKWALGLDSGCCYGKELTAAVITDDVRGLELVSVSNKFD